MALLEVRNDIVMQHGRELRKRFYHDGGKRCSVVLWQRQSDQGIDRFQASLPGHVFEWKVDSALRYAREDEGDNPMGMKQSPVMMMGSKVNKKALDEFIKYLEQQKSDVDELLHSVMDILSGELQNAV